MDVEVIVVVGLAILGGLVLFFSGRMRERYGTLRPSEAVTRIHEQYELRPELVYYTSGPDVYPRALIGIDRGLILDSDLWKRRDFQPETFRDTIRDMQNRALSTMQMLHGFEILDQRGNRIGTWFSVLDVRTIVQMLKDKRVRVDPPTLTSASESP